MTVTKQLLQQLTSQMDLTEEEVIERSLCQFAEKLFEDQYWEYMILRVQNRNSQTFPDWVEIPVADEFDLEWARTLDFPNSIQIARYNLVPLDRSMEFLPYAIAVPRVIKLLASFGIQAEPESHLDMSIEVVEPSHVIYFGTTEKIPVIVSDYRIWTIPEKRCQLNYTEWELDEDGTLFRWGKACAEAKLALLI